MYRRESGKKHKNSRSPKKKNERTKYREFIHIMLTAQQHTYHLYINCCWKTEYGFFLSEHRISKRFLTAEAVIHTYSFLTILLVWKNHILGNTVAVSDLVIHLISVHYNATPRNHPSSCLFRISVRTGERKKNISTDYLSFLSVNCKKKKK